ncbi:MAG: zinc-binding dehydrogenase [Deltaproteobacteria bacterium]|nr:zinc-binding dehydrogenase [Deltaproteobacteria bacterium]
MTISTDAWVLHAGQPGETQRASLVRESFEFSSLGNDEVLAAPLYGCWEGNMDHALTRKPVDVCHHRGEDRVVLGNAGVVEVQEVGAAVTSVKRGQLAMICANAVFDRYGYPQLMLAYDAPGTMGILAKQSKFQGHCLIPLPDNTKYSLAQWAAFSVRYSTAWSNWRLAYGTLRLLLSKEELPHPNVWAWGSGTALAELELAGRDGCKCVMLSGNDKRLATIKRCGIVAVDRRAIGDVNFDERRFSTDLAWRKGYVQAENRLLEEVKRQTSGEGVNVFVDYIGESVFRATLKTLAREGIVTTAGWKTGQVITMLRGMECIQRHQHLHTHGASNSEAIAAMRYGEAHGWMPNLADTRIYRFDEIPELAQAFASSDHDVFPIFSVRD